MMSLLEQMYGSNFPVHAVCLPSTIATVDEVKASFPERTDGQLDEVAIESTQFFKSNNSKIGSYIAAEGLTFDLTQKKKDPFVSTANLFEF